MSVVRPMSRLGTLAFKVPIKVPAMGTVIEGRRAPVPNFRTPRQTSTHAERQTHRHADRLADTLTDRKTGTRKHADTQARTHRQTERQT